MLPASPFATACTEVLPGRNRGWWVMWECCILNSSSPPPKKRFFWRTYPLHDTIIFRFLLTDSALKKPIRNLLATPITVAESPFWRLTANLSGSAFDGASRPHNGRAARISLFVAQGGIRAGRPAQDGRGRNHGSCLPHVTWTQPNGKNCSGSCPTRATGCSSFWG